MATSSRVAHRYAKAIFDIARQESSSDTVIEDMRTLRGAIDGSSDLRAFLASPVIDVHTKERIIGAIFNGKVGTIMDRFITLMALKGRAASLSAIVDAFHHLIDDERNIVEATITTAIDLDAEQKSRIEGQIAKISGHGIRARYIIDPAIIGGFRARFEDRMIDATVSHQLERLRESLTIGGNN
ncbi:MAG: ATP synthase F1 subunit delta [Candidatus Kapaibacterium sp.]